jgi:small ligand-binding sensory domain FIST
VGFDRERGGFSIPEPVRSGDRLALVELHPQSARETFRDQLERLRDPAPCLGLYFNCRARGAALFGEPGVEATYLANAFADCPILGVTGPFQLSPPVPGAPARVLTYAGVLAVLDGS